MNWDECPQCGKEFRSETVEISRKMRWLSGGSPLVWTNANGRSYRLKLYEADGRLHTHIHDGPMPPGPIDTTIEEPMPAEVPIFSRVETPAIPQRKQPGVM